MDDLAHFPDRSPAPVIAVEDLAWLEFEKADLDAAERFAHDFGFVTAHRTKDALHLRGQLAGTQAIVFRQGARSRFLAPVFRASSRVDLETLASVAGGVVEANADLGGGFLLDLHDPDGALVRVVADVETLPALDALAPSIMNVGTNTSRINAPQRPARAPAQVQRLGHVVLQRPNFQKTLRWYLDHFGLIVSDFQYLPGQRDAGPAMAFVRCNRGDIPVDHHTIAMVLGPSVEYVHSAYQVRDLDALTAGGEFLRERGYRRSWGVGRHIQGSQIFDYWRDPDGLLMEHFTDGDLFDDTVPAGWSEMTASGLAQWGPAATRDFLGIPPKPAYVKSLVAALRDRSNEFDKTRLAGLLKVASK